MQNQIRTMADMGEFSEGDIEVGEEYNEEEAEEVEHDENSESSEEEQDELAYDGDIEVDEAVYTDECAVNITHFDIVKKLGSGAYGDVYLVKKNCGIDINTIYALKVISKEKVMPMPKTITHMKAERKALEILRHCPYIQKLYYAFQTDEKLFLVLEYASGGELFTQVQKSPLSEQTVRFYIAELVVALEHIHLQGIAYRDIKLENVLLSADGHIKLVDFGLCKKLGARGRAKSFCGTEEYMAPEVIACTGHDTAADWWALGVLTIELLSTVTPFGVCEGDNQSIMDRVQKDSPTMPVDISEDMRDFLEKILIKDPTKRLGGSEASAIDIKNHRLFNDIDWDELARKRIPAPSIPPLDHPFDVQNFSEEFTQLDPIVTPSEVPPRTFVTFKGYSYIAPELRPSENNDHADGSIDENWNSLTRHILSNRDPNSDFHKKYDFATHSPLGIGKSSICMKCFNKMDNNYYAVKIYSHQDKNDHEIDLLQKAAKERIPGVVYLVEVLTDSRWTYLIMELIEHPDLLHHLTTLDARGVCNAFSFVFKLMKTIHKLKYVHGRICFKNIRYLDHISEIRLIGFGHAKPINDTQVERIDFWSLGVCIYTVLCGHAPFNLIENSNITEMSIRILKNDFDRKSEQWRALHKSVQQLIGKLISTVSSCSASELRRIRNTVPPVVWSNELVDENKKIIEMSATDSLPLMKIKQEAIIELNDIAVITNGHGSSSGHTRDESASNHAHMNGDARKMSSKRPIENTTEQTQPKKRKRNKLPEIKQEIPTPTRKLRTRERQDYAKKVNMKSAKTENLVQTASVPNNQAEFIDVKDIKVLPPERQPIPKNKVETRGRPKKTQKTNDKRKKLENPANGVAPVIPDKKHSKARVTSENTTNGNSTMAAQNNPTNSRRRRPNNRHAASGVAQQTTSTIARPTQPDRSNDHSNGTVQWVSSRVLSVSSIREGVQTIIFRPRLPPIKPYRTFERIDYT